MNEALVKDDILKKLSEKREGIVRGIGSNDLSKNIELDHPIVICLIDKLVADNLVDGQATSGYGGLSGRIATINSNGLTFLKFGGYTSGMRKERRQKVWIFVKSMAAVFNSILVVGIAYWGVETQAAANKKNDTSTEIVLLKHQLNAIKLKVDSLGSRSVRRHKLATLPKNANK
jgi:hypothetical protein